MTLIVKSRPNSLLFLRILCRSLSHNGHEKINEFGYSNRLIEQVIQVGLK